MPKTTTSRSAAPKGPKGRNRKDPSDALKLVKPGGRAGQVPADKVLVNFENGSKGVYWATPAEKKKREAARKTKAKSKRGKKKVKAPGKKRGRKKGSARKGKSSRRVAGMPNLQGLSNDRLLAIRHAVDGEINARIANAEKELGSLKKAVG